LAVALVDWLTSNKNWFWAVGTIDGFVLGGILGLLVAAICKEIFTRIWPDAPVSRWLRRAGLKLGSFVLVILTLYVAYASFRNQSRLASEASLNSESISLYQIEAARPELRCLYFNYGHENANVCLANLVSSSENWSLAIFYVEESWFILSRATEEHVNWGSSNAAWIRGWAEDIGRDPTGLFSYYLISASNTLADTREWMRQAGVQIAEPCENYRRVWAALGEHGHQPASVSGAALECGITDKAVYTIYD
jgi:hypothetical protein